jgi:hypothetical protein
MVESGQANFIPRDSFLQFMKDHPDAALRVTEQLSSNYFTALEGVRAIDLASNLSQTLQQTRTTVWS